MHSRLQSTLLGQAWSDERAPGPLLDGTHRQDNPQDSKQVLQNSITYDLTYYDSAYLTAAEKRGATLVTDDKKLAKAAHKADIPTIDSDTMFK